MPRRSNPPDASLLFDVQRKAEPYFNDDFKTVIAWVPVDRIVPGEYNAGTDESKLKSIASAWRSGIRVPVPYGRFYDSEDGPLVRMSGGHHRTRLAASMGVKVIPLELRYQPGQRKLVLKSGWIRA